MYLRNLCGFKVIYHKQTYFVSYILEVDVSAYCYFYTLHQYLYNLCGFSFNKANLYILLCYWKHTISLNELSLKKSMDVLYVLFVHNEEYRIRLETYKEYIIQKCKEDTSKKNEK